MKKLLLICILMVTFTFVYGQKSIDLLFDKYAGKDGFTTVTINGGLLRLAKWFDCDAGHDDDLPAGLSEIRILSQNDTTLKVGNFYNMVIKDIDLTSYEEFMRIKESDQDLRMLVKTDGDKFREFLLISGGSDNAIIQIKGNLSLKDAKKMAGDAQTNKGLDISAEYK